MYFGENKGFSAINQIKNRFFVDYCKQATNFFFLSFNKLFYDAHILLFSIYNVHSWNHFVQCNDYTRIITFLYSMNRICWLFFSFYNIDIKSLRFHCRLFISEDCYIRCRGKELWTFNVTIRFSSSFFYVYGICLHEKIHINVME